MKICQLITSHGEGGLEKHVRDLSQQLVANGHEVLVMGDKRYLSTLPDTVLTQAIYAQLSRRNPILLLDLLAKLHTCDCDIVHAQANKAVTLASTLGNRFPIPIVGTLHNIKSNIKPFLKLDQIITVSKHLAKPFPKNRTSVIYNGISHSEFHQLDIKKKFHLPEKTPVLCAVGRLVTAKGFDILLKAIDGLAVSLIIAGEGPERTNLERQIKSLNPNTRCVLLGHRNDIPTLMASVDGIIICSRREGFSYVFNEAALIGTNVLATDVPVANEVLPNTLIVPTDNSLALREKIQVLLNDMEGWASLMKPIQAFAQQQMTLEEMTNKTVSVYQKTINSKTT